jgi:tetratricopeptide (TPR) repeat protein
MAATDADSPETGYSVREVSELLGITPRQIRSFVADGFLSPTIGERSKYLFSFQDLVMLRAAADLLEEGVRPARLHAALRELADQLPSETRLTEATLDVVGRNVVVKLDEDVWEPESGQTVLDFEVRGIADKAVAISDARRSIHPNSESAYDWYAYADDIEATDPAKAESAYRKAIELDPGLVEAHLNLGRLLHTGGAVHDALEQYRSALGAGGDDAIAWFNIGVASQDLGDRQGAVEAYERTLELSPRFADARYNLAALYEDIGDVALALQHLRAYRELIEGR